LEYKYKYNGKEWQDELGLNMYDYGARNYDPALGRWMNIDPLAETSRRWSPFTYCYNSPMVFVDPDGMRADWYSDADGNIVHDEKIKSQEDLDKADIKGEYIKESFVAKDQNGSIYSFEKDGTIEKSKADVTLVKAAGIDTDSMMEVKSSVVEDGNTVKQPQQANAALIGVLAFASADAVTPEPSDAIAPAKAALYGAIATAAVITGAILSEPDVIMSFAKTKPGKAGEVSGAEHTSGARASTKGKHEAGQTRNQQVNRDKKRQNPNWKRH
jgi:RHS repeat-associated protein